MRGKAFACLCLIRTNKTNKTMQDEQYKFMRNAYIAYEHIMENLEEGKQGDANQLLSAIALVVFNDVEYQVQLVFNSEKVSWLGTNEVGLCKSKSEGFLPIQKDFDA
jgi:hypothetical protein